MRDDLRTLGLAAAVTCVAVALRVPLVPWLGSEAPYLTLFPTVLAIAFALGLRPALLSIVVAALGARFVSNLPDFALGFRSTADVLGSVVFVATTTALAWAADRERRSAALVVAERMRAAGHQERLRQVVSSLPTALCVARGEDLTIEIANPASAALFGRAPPAGSTLPSLLPAALAPVLDDVARARETGARQVRRGVRLTSSDGHELTIDVAVVPLASEGAPPQERAVLVCGLDVTDQAAALRRAESLSSLFDAVLAAAPIGIAWYDHDLRYLNLNDALAAMNAQPREAHLGRSIREILPAGPETDAVVDRLTRVLETGEPVPALELAWSPSDAPREERFALASYYPVRVDGVVVGAAATVVDLSDRRAAERALEHERQRLEVALGALPASIAITRGPDHVVEWVNERYAAGIPDGLTVLGRAAREIFPELPGHVFELADRAWRTGEPVLVPELVVEVPLPDGSVAESVSNASWIPLRGADGRVERLVSSFYDVTEHVRTRRRIESLAGELERAQRASEAQRAMLHGLFQQAPVALAMWRGPEHVFELASPAYLELFGRSDVIGRPVREVFPEAELRSPGFFEIWDRVYRTGEPFVAHEWATTTEPSDGGPRHPRFVAFALVPYRGEAGEIEGLVVVAVDVTPQVLARREVESLADALQRSEQRYRELFDGAAVAMWEEDFSGVVTLLDELRARGVEDVRAHLLASPEALADAIGRIRVIGVNEECARLFGASDPTELVGGLSGVVTAETAQVFLEEIVAIAEGRTVFEAETTMTTLAGESRDVVCAIRFPPRGGAFSRVPVSVIDISARKRGERTLDFLARASAVLSGSVDQRTMLGDVVRLAVSSIADWACVQVRGAGDHAVVVAVAHADAAREAVLRARLEQGDPLGTGHVIADGRARLVSGEPAGALADLSARSWISVPITLADGVYGVVTLGVSDHRRRQDEDDLAVAGELGRRVAIAVEYARTFEIAQRERARAEAASRAKDLFLSTLSHELRTPLTAIVGWTSLVRSGRLPAGKIEHAFDVIDRNARSQVALIEEILDLSRIATGKLRLESAAVDLADVVRAAVDTVRPAADAKGVRLDVSLEGADERVHGDATRLQQVAWNLLSNAVKFTPREGRVEVVLRRAGSQIELAVRDTGRGIDPAFLPYVFDAFRQEDASSTREQGGLGLGLALSRHLIELHGGTLSAASEGLGRGAVLTARVPVAPLHTTPRALVSAREPSGLELPEELRGARVLLVEDTPDARELLATVLEQSGVRVTAVADVQGAMRELGRGAFDLVVSDIGMPGEDGYALIRRIRALPRAEGGATPAVALTAYAGPADRARVLEAGFAAHVAKPIEPRELLRVLARAIRERPS